MNVLHVLAALITVITALINVFVAIGGQPLNITPPQIDVHVPNLLLKIVLFFYLELFICLFFSYIKIKVLDIMDNLSQFWLFVLAPLVISILLISGWTSVFNIEWIFFNLTWDYTFLSFNTLALFFWALTSIGLMGFAGLHIEGIIENNFDKKEEWMALFFMSIHCATLLIVIIYKYLTT